MREPALTGDCPPQRVPNRPTPRHITIKVAKIKSKEKILKAFPTIDWLCSRMLTSWGP